MKELNRRNFIKYASAGIGAVAAGMPAGLMGEEARKKHSKRPNILWIMMDDCRADALGCYGKPWPRTPYMDNIANQGVRFQTAIVQSPVCTPSRTSMKSGYYAHITGSMSMGPPNRGKTKQYKPNLVNSWKRIGINPVNIGKRNAYDDDWDHRGDVVPNFDVFGKPIGENIKLKLKQSGSRYPEVVTKTHKWAIGGTIPLEPEETSIWKLGDLAVDTLKELAETNESFFFRVSFHAPHVPCRISDSYMIDADKITLPLPTEGELKTKPQFERENLHVYAGGLDLTKEQIRIARGTYYGMVSLVDTQVGRMVEVLKKAGLINNTIIAINADQGFQLGEHGLWKKRVFYEQNVCVPFIISCPELLPTGMVIEEPVEMVDFLPTLMDFSGLDVPDTISGRTLCPLIQGNVKEWKPACFCEHDYATDMYEELRKESGRCVMVRTKEWKMVYFMDKRISERNGSLYNLKNDPDEKDNLYGKPEYSDVTKHLEDLTEKWDQAT